MLEIKVTLDKTEAKDYLEQHEVRIDLLDKLVMHATESGKTCGFGVISIGSGNAEIDDICCENDMDYIMGKSLLNLIDNAGIETVYCSNERIAPLLLKLRFKEDGQAGRFILNLAGYFGGGC